MKLYISADIEGVAGIAAASEVDMSKGAEYAPFQKQMTDEVAAACRGGFAAGAEAIMVKDAHWTGRNIDVHALTAPEGRQLQIIRGWSGHPYAMVQGIDSSYAAAAFVGYHSAAGLGGNPLAHTLSGRAFARMEINGQVASEFMLYGYAAATVGVPVAFLSGDAALCAQAEALVDGIVTVATLQGQGASTVSITPGESVRRIEAGVAKALKGRLPPPLAVPSDLHLRLVFNKPADAYAKSFYPGARQTADNELVFETREYLPLLTFLWFAAQ
jgi:D-amino peptidase